MPARRPARCTGPGCDRDAVSRGLCAAHSRQRERRRDLTPLRGPHGQIGDAPLVRVSTHVPPPVAERLGPDRGATLRRLAEEWARRR
jgi:hypothetical protein